MSAKNIRAQDLPALCEGLLLDSYGVLVNTAGLLEGADSFVQRLSREAFPFAVLTNDASRRPETLSAWYRDLGLAIPAEKIISSGLLVADYIQEKGLGGARAKVLGPPDSEALVAEAGVQVLPLNADTTEIEVVVVCDEAGYPFLESLDEILSLIWNRARQGQHTHLLLPNPDRVYPRAAGKLGLGAGAVAHALENALAAALPDQERLTFFRLGKPHAPIFKRGRNLLGVDEIVMVGDQLETDIKGAMAAGMKGALIATGVLDPNRQKLDPVPDFLLESLS
jgi:HAD superfamily hydrolase (TIGR01450 family)